MAKKPAKKNVVKNTGFRPTSAQLFGGNGHALFNAAVRYYDAHSEEAAAIPRQRKRYGR